MPPARAVGRVWIFRALGRSIAPILLETRREKGKSARESKKQASISAEFIKIIFNIITTPIMDEKAPPLFM